MRGVIWIVLLFAVAVVAATTLGTNDGLVTLYWRGWRTDFSLNLFLIIVAAAGPELEVSGVLDRVCIAQQPELQARRSGVDDEDAHAHSSSGQVHPEIAGSSSPCSRV